MKIFGYLKNHLGAVLLIVVLLIGQAFCDLALPTYTSDIVDVGIQQKGIDHPSASSLRAQTYEDIALLADDEDSSLIEESYEQGDDGTYRLTTYGAEHRTQLDEAVSVPMVLLSAIQERDDIDIQAMRSLAAANPVQAKALLAQAKSEVSKQLDSLGGSLIQQRAIIFTQQEYAAQGIDVDGMQMNYLFFTGLQMLAVTLGMVICAVCVGLVASRTAAAIARNLRRRLFEKVVSFSQAEFSLFSTASLITRSTNDIQQIQMVLVMLLRMILYAPILGIGGVIMISTTNVSMSWIIGLAVLLILGGVAVMFAVALPKFKIMQKLIDRINLIAREILTGVSVVRAFRRERYEENRFEIASANLMRTQLFTNRVMMLMMPLMMLVMNGVSVLIVWTGAQQIDMGAMQVGDMIAFITYAMVIIMSFLMLCMVSIMLPRAGVAAERVNEVLETEATIVDPENPLDIAALEQAAGENAGTITFDHVSFRFAGAEQDMLHDISFTAKPGTTTAIIGSTGSGKSTLLNLIPRFYDVTAGSITVDGADIRQLTQHDLHSLIGYVPQKGILFSGTVESNLKFADPGMSDERMEQAAITAQATDFIEADSDGFKRAIAQGGSNVSGGQKQRLSIARALAKNAPILLFDDSFSALDYATDMKLRTALNASAETATILIVAQRIATILHADTILVLDEGRIVGEGTHGELLESCPTYREIAASQLSASELEGGAR